VLGTKVIGALTIALAAPFCDDASGAFFGVMTFEHAFLGYVPHDIGFQVGPDVDAPRKRIILAIAPQ
jgi:hypothetical protein